MSDNVSQLQEFIRQKIPVSTKRETTIFDIARFPHYENVMTNCYAYFLSRKEEHGLAGLFLDSLLQLVSRETGKVLQLDDWDVETEVSTSTLKRIDLVVTEMKTEQHGDSFQRKMGDKYIIIENKIYHWLANDLSDYWNYFKVSDQNKIGVVLSLNHINIPPQHRSHFVNIRHCEWIQAVKQTPLYQSTNKKIKFYIGDFFAALDNLTNDINMDDQTRFYFQNVEKASEVVDTYNASWRYVVGQLGEAAGHLNLRYTGSAEFYRYFEFPDLKNGDIYYTVMFDNLFNKPLSLRVVIEIRNAALRYQDVFDKTLSNDIIKLGLLPKNVLNQGWVQYTGKDYCFSPDEMERLGFSLANFLKKDLQPIMDNMQKIMEQP